MRRLGKFGSVSPFSFRARVRGLADLIRIQYKFALASLSSVPSLSGFPPCKLTVISIVGNDTESSF